MARTISRSAKLTDVIYLRCTPEDKARLKMAAQEKGMDISTLLRQLLIKDRLITPL